MRAFWGVHGSIPFRNRILTHRGEKLKIVQNLLERRRARGKEAYDERGRVKSNGKRKNLSGQDVMKIYQKEVDRKQMITRKAAMVSQQKP